MLKTVENCNILKLLFLESWASFDPASRAALFLYQADGCRSRPRLSVRMRETIGFVRNSSGLLETSHKGAGLLLETSCRYRIPTWNFQILFVCPSERRQLPVVSVSVESLLTHESSVVRVIRCFHWWIGHGGSIIPVWQCHKMGFHLCLDVHRKTPDYLSNLIPIQVASRTQYRLMSRDDFTI